MFSRGAQGLPIMLFSLDVGVLVSDVSPRPRPRRCCAHITLTDKGLGATQAAILATHKKPMGEFGVIEVEKASRRSVA